MTAGQDVLDAYRHCEQVTRSQARNFYYGIALLPAEKRRALCAVYALARRVDDIGDGGQPPAAKLTALGEVRRRIEAGDDGGDPVLVALADAARRRPIPLPAFLELVEGCEADVRGTTYATFEQLLHYCRCVAGSIGRLSLGVFGARDLAAAAPLADALGVALQLTNILRDLREDRLTGRVYLPAADLARFGCRLEVGADGRIADPPDAFAALVRFEADRAERWYQQGLRLLPLLDRRSAACCAAMSGIYHRLLTRITAEPATTADRRVSLPGREKALVAARSLLAAAA